MLRGILTWMAFCLSLVVIWHLADYASARERLLHENYAMEGSPGFAQPDEPPIIPVARPAPKWHRCDYEPLDCEGLGCRHRRAQSAYSRLQ